MPEAKLLSNGSYHLMVSATGGYSRWNRLALTRWLEDSTLGNWGTFCYLRDNDDVAVWSTLIQPTLRIAERGEATFQAGSVCFTRPDHEIELCTDFAVSPDDDVELPRVRITNRSSRRMALCATSYVEIVLADPATDSAHLAFSKLFVETEIERDLHAILATRHPSKPTNPTPWLFHLALTADPGETSNSYEIDWMRFIGRGCSTADPQALQGNAALSDTAGAVLVYAGETLRAHAPGTIDALGGQHGLWRFGISGDLPIVLLEISDPQPKELVGQLVRAQAYWRAYGLKTDLVITVTRKSDGDALSGQVKEAVAAASSKSEPGEPGAVFVLDQTALDADGRRLLQSVARVALSDAAGTLAEQVEQHAGPSRPSWPTGRHIDKALLPPLGPIAGNNWSEFTADASEYVITSSMSRMTPAPWVNVLANPQFGTLISESGSATTWSENAHEFRLTPWSNDPVSDANTEALYIRDDESGRLWSPTLLSVMTNALRLRREK